MSVEQLVMQTMEEPFEPGAVSLCRDGDGNDAAVGESESELMTKSRRIEEQFCGGWVGWHCEGAPLRSLFGLMMWTELFPCCDEEEKDEWRSCGPAAPSLTPQPVPDVFRTPYQDAPLDLLTPGGLFYRNRQKAIEHKLSWIQASSTRDIIEHLGQVVIGRGGW